MHLCFFGLTNKINAVWFYAETLKTQLPKT